MEFNLTTPAILFPAISLLLLAYTNRFLAIANIVRGLVSRSQGKPDANTICQIQNLRQRIILIKCMQAFGISSLFFCVFAIILLYFEYTIFGKSVFGLSLFLMLISLAFSFWEIMKSGVALRMELNSVLNNRED